ncbi:MAG: hypothetical protein V4819_00470 [Verrucomicrobiota bacterium]
MENLMDLDEQNRVLTLLNDTRFELQDLSRLIPKSNREAHKVVERALKNVTVKVDEMFARKMPIS